MCELERGKEHFEFCVSVHEVCMREREREKKMKEREEGRREGARELGRKEGIEGEREG